MGSAESRVSSILLAGAGNKSACVGGHLSSEGGRKQQKMRGLLPLSAISLSAGRPTIKPRVTRRVSPSRHVDKARYNFERTACTYLRLTILKNRFMTERLQEFSMAVI